MALRRSSLLLLGAVLALLSLPSSALAQLTNTTPPTPAAWQTSPYVVTLQGGPDAVDMQWQLGVAGAITTVTNPTEITIPTLGVHDFRTQALDAGGIGSGWRSETLRIDTVDPTDASVLTTPANASGWHLAATSFEVSAVDITSGVDHVEWVLDGGAVQSGPNGTNVPISANGVHLLRTRAVDVAGNVSDWTDHTIRIDAVLPTDTTTLPSGWRTTPVDVTVRGTDAHSGVDEVEWVIDGGAPATDSPEGQFTLAADGVHDVQTLVRDVAGNVSGYKSHSVKIDTTTPDNLTTVPAGWVQSAHVAVAATDTTSGIDRVEWQIDGGPWLNGASGTVLDFTVTGEYQLRTRARDLAGNVSPVQLDNVQVDATAPANTTTAAPVIPVSNPYEVAVTGTDDDSGVASIEWRVDGGAVTAGDPGDLATVTGVTDTYTLETRIIDEAGNASAWRPDTIQIDAALGDNLPPVDTTAPAGSNTVWFSDPVTVTVQAVDTRSGVTQLQYRLPGETTKTVTGPTQVLLDKEGANVIETRAKDGANPANWSAWRSQTYKIDLSLPVDTTDIPEEWQGSSEFELAGTDERSGVDVVGYEIDGGGEQFGEPGDMIDVGADGSYEITTRVIDNAGHSSDYTTRTLKVDTVDPVNTSDVPDTDWIKGSLALALSGTDLHLAPMQWRVDGGEIQNGDTATIDEDGEYLLETRAIDLAGNFTAWRPDTVKIDATLPVNTTAAAPAGWRRTAYSVEVEGNDGEGSGVDRIERKVDGGAVSNDPNVTISGDGVHTLSSRIVDEVGYESAWRDDVIRIDTVKPTAALSCGTAAWRRTSAACTVTANGGLSGLSSLRVAGADGGTRSVASGTVATVSRDGTHTVRLGATDGAGNVAAAQAVVRVDRTAPVATLTCAPRGSAHSCRADASDATSGLAVLGWSVDGGEFTSIGAGQSFGVASGAVRLRAVDAAGNQVVTEPVTLELGATVRVTSAPVYLRGRKKTDNLVGALSAARSAGGTVSLDLRPLAVGRGRFRVVLQLKSGKRSRKVRRTVKVGRTGALPRMSASLSRATGRTKVTLTVRKRSGRRWKKYAGARFVLAK